MKKSMFFMFLALIALCGCSTAPDTVQTTEPTTQAAVAAVVDNTETLTEEEKHFTWPSYPTAPQTPAADFVDAAMQLQYTKFYYQDIVMDQIPYYLDHDNKKALELLREAYTKFETEEATYNAYANNEVFDMPYYQRDVFREMAYTLEYTRNYAFKPAIEELENDENRGSDSFSLIVNSAYSSINNLGF